MFLKQNKQLVILILGIDLKLQFTIKREIMTPKKDKNKLNSMDPNNNFDRQQRSEASLCWGCQQEPLSERQNEIIIKLLSFQQLYHSPSEEDLKQITIFSLGDSEEDCCKRFLHFIELTILTVQCVVEFAKKLFYFDTLFREDKIALLKACSSGMLLLDSARKYDRETDSLFLAYNRSYKREDFDSMCLGNYTDSLFNFCRTMCNLEVDKVEYALLTAILIFTVRPSLLEPEKVQKIQDFYLDTLVSYISTKQPSTKNYCAKLLNALSQAHIVGHMHSQLTANFSLQNKTLLSVLNKYLDNEQ